MKEEELECTGDHLYENYIARYIHCSLCIEEMPENISPRMYAHNEVGILINGDIQVWCVRHEKNVVIFDMEKSSMMIDPDVEPVELGECDECNDQRKLELWRTSAV